MREIDQARNAERRAAARARTSESGIGAAVVERSAPVAGSPGPWRCRLSDGRLFAWVGILVGDDDIAAAEVEDAIEAYALALPPGDRLLALEARSPLPYPLG